MMNDRPRSRRPVLRPNSLNILHEDADLLVVDKPPGLLSSRMPDDERDSLFDFIKEHVRAGRRKPMRVWIIHRLDKEASGLLVFAKSEKAFNWLKEDFRAKRMNRLYTAVVEGEITDAAEAGEGASKPRFRQPPSGTIQSFIRDDEAGNVTSVGIGELAREGAKGRQAARPPRGAPPSPYPVPAHRGRFMGPLDDDAPRLAVTHYRVLGTGEGRSLLQIRLDTGRKNQIRIHMQEFKHPIIGDARYGAATNPIGRLALHASELAFTHPTTGQTIRFNSPAPASFYRALGMQPPKAAPEEAMPIREPARAAPAPDARSTAPIAPPEAPAAPSPATSALPETSWDHVAAWYDLLIEEDRSDHFKHTIIPGTLRLLRPPQQAAFRVLDIACGQGSLCRRMAQLGVEAIGVDASERLITAARRHSHGDSPPDSKSAMPACSATSRPKSAPPRSTPQPVSWRL
jgi:23S rRNA pseudouridine1911/1915/1917 synthase